MDNNEIVRSWTQQLAEHLNRPAAEILEKGLSAYDFPVDEEVEILFDNGDAMQFKFAFFIVDEERKLLAVFTEHSGYFQFPSSYLKVTSTRTIVFVGDEYDS